MTELRRLHDAARRYCIDGIPERYRRYAELGDRGLATVPRGAHGWDYTDDARDLFPRYQILQAILLDVERLVPGDYASVDELRDWLVAAGATAVYPGAAASHPIIAAAIEDERRRFLAFVTTTDLATLPGGPALPYRRTLAQIERNRLHEAFVARWGRWYAGGVEGGPCAALQTLHVAAMREHEGYDALRAALAGHGVVRLFELRDCGDAQYELDLADVSFDYNGDEGFWTLPDADWMVYASHEDSITFGGSWLIAEMRQALPEFDRYLYKGWGLDRY